MNGPMQLRDKLFHYPWQSYTENNCNCYLIDGSVRTLIDPGHLQFMGDLESRLVEDGFALEDIGLVIGTHPHPDHCEGLSVFGKLPARTAMHQQAEGFFQEFAKYWEQLTGRTVPAIQLDFFLQRGELKVGKETLQVIETPGHAPGSICLYWVEEKALFSGDVIFSQGMGRTDFPGGDPLALVRSIDSLMELDVELLLPGHGPPVAGKGAVKENFYLVHSLLQQMF
jgi:hydroxyacylglutathione hydrolase